MKRPAKTKKQRTFDRSQRALLRLRKAAVRWSRGHKDSDGDDDGEMLVFLLTDLQAAADKYTESLSPREVRKLARR